MVEQLGMCILDDCIQDNEGSSEIVVTSKLDTCRDLGAFKVSGKDNIWFGVRLQCCEVPLAVSLFPQLQVHLHKYFTKHCQQKPSLWLNGAGIALPFSDTMGILEIRRGRMAIDIMVHGAEKSRRSCFCLMKILKEETLLKVEDFSPGSDISEKILSSRELSTLNWSNTASVPRFVYKKDDVERAMEQGGQIRPSSEEDIQELEDAYDLMAISSTHVLLLTPSGRRQFCYEMNCYQPAAGSHGSSKWLQVFRQLGLCEHEIKEECLAVSSPSECALNLWSRRSASHTIERLLSVVESADCHDAAAILQKELEISQAFVLRPEQSQEEFSAAEYTRDTINRSYRLYTTTIEEASRNFNDFFDCKKLAVYLQISYGGRFVSALRSANQLISPSNTAYEILMAWRREKGSFASDMELRRVLTDKLKMVDLCEHLWPNTCTDESSDEISQQSIDSTDNHSSIRHSASCKDEVCEIIVMDIALSFSDFFQCKRLAVSLDLSRGSEFVSAKQSQSPRISTHEMAYDIMMEWKKEKGHAATGKQLHSVLHDEPLKMVDTAMKFRAALCHNAQ